MTDQDTIELMTRHAAAWNAHDVEVLLALMTPDCVYDAAAGMHPHGDRHIGHEALRTAFAAIWKAFPDARWDDASHAGMGELGVSQWTFRGTRADGQTVVAKGLDVLRFRDGRICHKDTYRKAVTN